MVPAFSLEGRVIRPNLASKRLEIPFVRFLQRSPKSLPLKSPWAYPEYMLLVYDEERKKGAGHAALRGEPGAGGPQDKAAFYKAKAEAEAQAKVQSLRALRLERHLEQLREQHQREVEQLREQHQRQIEKLQGQYQKRIEKLGRRLARIKKQNRVLENQLQSVQ